MRYAIFFFVALAASLSLGASAPVIYGLPPEPPENQRTNAHLEKIIDVSFEDAPLDMVIDFLRSVGDINIFLDERALQGRAPSEIRVNLKLRQVRLRTVVEFVALLSGLKTTVKNGVVVFSDEEGAREPLYRVTYDVRDLIIRVPDFAGPGLEIGGGTVGTQLGVPGAGAGVGAGVGAGGLGGGLGVGIGGGGGGGVSFSPYGTGETPSGYGPAASPDEAGEELVRLIEETILSDP